jgi:hypothetical protein
MTDDELSLELIDLKQIWPAVAASAWFGYQAHGRGAMLVELARADADIEEAFLGFSYMHWPSAGEAPDEVKTYNPETEIVFILIEQDQPVSICVMYEVPPPLDAAKGCTNPHLGLSLHAH